MNLRRRLENSDVLAAILSWILATYLRFCFSTGKWTFEGWEGLKADLKDGPILLVLWHERLVGFPKAWPFELGKFSSLHDTSPAGRVGAETFKRLGVEANQINAKSDSQAVTRKIIRDIRNGNSLGMAADGPNGPARQARRATLDWARIANRPIYLFAWSARRSVRLNTWDNLMLPLPFSSGTFAFRLWETVVPRKLDSKDYARLKTELSEQLDDLVRTLDERTGVSRSD